jgi:hypothetical protein
MLSRTIGIVFFASRLRARWNAMLQGNRDRFLSMTRMSIGIVVVPTLVVRFTPWQAGASWPYIV